MMDLVDEPPPLQKMIDMVLAYNLGAVQKMLKHERRMYHFGDDLGMQDRLAMGPDLWRRYLKPCFAKIFQPIRRTGAHVYLHTDGHILPIIGDLIECGVTVLNPQIRANGLDGLVRECKDKVALNLDLDRQLFPFCTPNDIREHVREAVLALGSKRGGLMLSAECEPDVPLENIEAICQALEDHMSFFD
jgi:uroporphyrinogen decarboxylase